MALQGQRNFFPGDALAVVTYPHAVHSAALKFNRNFCGPCIQGIFKKLLQDRGGTFDHLACRNLVHQLCGQWLNRSCGEAAHVMGTGFSSCSCSIC